MSFFASFLIVFSILESLFLYSRKLIPHKNQQNASYNEFVKNFLENPKNLLITFMTGKCFSAVLVVLLIASIILKYWWNVYSLIIIAIISFLFLFIFAELIPKIFTIKLKSIDKVVIQLIGPLKLLQFIFYPINFPFILLMSSLLDKIAQQFTQDTSSITEEEIRAAVDLGAKTGALETEETELVHSALSFDETAVKNVMVPRVDIICTKSNSTINETLNYMITEGYSKLPVYEDNLDNIIGIVNLKDLLKAKQTSPDGSQLIKAHMRKAFYIPESKPINNLLKDMQSKRLTMAIVIDEYGGTAGLATMEDLLEEIVGEIRDEHDEPCTLIEFINENTIKVDAKVSAEDVNKFLGLNLPEGQAIAGLVFNTLGHVPQIGEELKINNASIKIESVQGIRLQKVIIERIPDMVEASNNSSKKILFFLF